MLRDKVSKEFCPVVFGPLRFHELLCFCPFFFQFLLRAGDRRLQALYLTLKDLVRRVPYLNVLFIAPLQFCKFSFQDLYALFEVPLFLFIPRKGIFKLVSPALKNNAAQVEDPLDIAFVGYF